MPSPNDIPVLYQLCYNETNLPIHTLRCMLTPFRDNHGRQHHRRNSHHRWLSRQQPRHSSPTPRYEHIRCHNPPRRHLLWQQTHLLPRPNSPSPQIDFGTTEITTQIFNPELDRKRKINLFILFSILFTLSLHEVKNLIKQEI